MTVDDFLREFKAHIKAEDGIEWYRKCIVAGWRYDHAYEGLPDKPSEYGHKSVFPLASGAPAGTVLESFPGARKLIRGADEGLFEATRIGDDDGSEVADTTGRPLPAGTYRYKSYYQMEDYIPCDFFPYYSYSHHKVVVTAPKGTLHELFFDPVNLGSGDATNGVLKPATFTDTNGASAMIQSIEWEASSTGSGQAGTVKITLSPHNGLTAHVVDFIELDGTVSLSLNVSAATVDSANDTLSWSVSEQPWHDGDKLMVRIREGPE